MRFNPSGTLDVGTDPADLPVQMQGKIAVSGAMTRCTNLTLDRTGIASTRRGSVKLNGSALDETDIHLIVERYGVRYIFAGTKLYQNESEIVDSLTDTECSAILYNSYNSAEQSIFFINGTDRKRITGSDVQEWGSESPTVAPTIAVAGESEITGDYNVKYTWCRKEDTALVWESNPSPAAAAAITLDAEGIDIYFTLPDDEQITHIRIYRTSADGSTYLYDQEIEIDTTEYDYSYIYDWEYTLLSGTIKQIFTDNQYSDGAATYSWELDDDYDGYDGALKSTQLFELETYAYSYQEDTALGIEASWVNHNRPPLGTVVIGPSLSGTCFMFKDNNLYFSLPNQPEYWPTEYYIEVGAKQYPIIAGAFLDGSLYVATSIEIFQISGASAGAFFPLPMAAQTGTVSKNCFVSVKGHGIYHLGNDGIYLYSGGKDQLVSRGNLDKIFSGESAGNIPGINRNFISNCWMVSFHGKLYIGFPGGTSTYPDNVLVYDLQSQKLVHYSYASNMQTVAIDSTNQRLLAGDSNGFVWGWEIVSQTDDDGTDISWQIQSAEFNHLRKYFPRYAKYDVQVGTGATANGYILLDDVSKQTHPLAGSRLTRKRLVTGCTGDRLAVRISGTGAVDIYGAEIE